MNKKIILCLICFVCGGLSAYFWYPDNPIEEFSEMLIQEETGMKIDLTPVKKPVKKKLKKGNKE